MSARHLFVSQPAGRRRLLVGVTAWVFLLTLFVLLLRPVRSDANVGAIALLMLLPPLALTGNGPIAAGIAAAVTGLVFNFNFTHPYDSPRIESSASFVAFVVYTLVAVAVAVIAARLREARTLADQRADAAQLLQTVGVNLLRDADLAETLPEAVRLLRTGMGFHGVGLDVAIGDQRIRASDGDPGALALARNLGEGPSMSPAAGLEVASIATARAAYGSLVVARDGPLQADERRVVGVFASVVALALDRAELAEAAARQRADEASQQVRSTLLQSVSHDLRTPLTAIKAAAVALQAADHLERSAQNAVLADVEQEADRLSRMVANLLDLSRIESGALRLHRAPVPVDELIDDALASAPLQVEVGRVDVRIADDLPLVDVDEALVRQVVVNLLDNALRAQPDLSIAITAAARDGRVELRFVDHGPGVPADARERLFVPYARVRPSDRGSGAGLGLAISRGFIEAHGGALWYEPTAGGGATFVVDLPAAA